MKENGEKSQIIYFLLGILQVVMFSYMIWL